MSTSVTSLCQLLIDDNFGELAARLFETFCIHGRLSYIALAQHSGFQPRRVKHGLAILIQQGIVVWNADNTENVFYEVSLQASYNLVRQGRLSRIVGERFDQLGQSVITTLLLSGHSRVSDIIDALVADKEKEDRKNAAQTNGQDNGDVRNGRFDVDGFKDEARTTVLALIDHGYVSVVHKFHFLPMADAQDEARKIELVKHNEKVKKADAGLFQNKVVKCLLDWKYNRSAREDIISATGLVEVKVAKRRRLADEELASSESSPKKRRLDEGVANNRLKLSYRSANQPRLSSLDNHVVKINFEKLAVICRNEQLTNLVKSRISEPTALVYEEVLANLTNNMLYCQGLTDPGLQAPLEDPDEHRGNDELTTVPTTTIITGVDLDDYGSGIGSAAKIKKAQTNGMKAAKHEDSDGDVEMEDAPSKRPTNGHAGTDDGEDEAPQSSAAKRKKRKITNKREFDEDDDATDVDFDLSNNPAFVIQSHLRLLKEDSFRYVEEHVGNHRSPQSWSIDFAASSKELRTSLILDIVRARFGMPGLRLVNLLRARGKLEQKTLETSSLLPKKQVLLLLTALHTAGFLDLQEVPRDNTRAPAKTVYLWFFDEARARTRIIEDTYKAMLRTFQRVKAEKDTHEKVIAKSQRTDVAENEDEMLSEREKRELKAWRDSTDKLFGELGRLDDVVFCLRDF